MKNRYSFTVLMALAYALIGCVKEADLPQQPVDPGTTTGTQSGKFADLKPSETFNWSTSRQITFNFKALETADYKLVLRVKTTSGQVMLQKLQRANEHFNTTLVVPTQVESLVVEFGDNIQSLDCRSGAILFQVQ